MKDYAQCIYDCIEGLTSFNCEQGVELQLGFAIDNVQASLAVKRRLACEQVKAWEQVCHTSWK